MYMLHQQQGGDDKRGQQRQLFIRTTGYDEKKKKDGRRMARKEEILGDEFIAIEEIAQRINQRDEAGRRIEWDKRDRQGAK